jgi:hypothetical protein
VTHCFITGSAALAICKQELQTAALLSLDLTELMCYTKNAIRYEGSGPRGKLATDKSVGLVRTEVADRFLMAGLPCNERRQQFDGMMRLHRSDFFC